MVTLTLLPLDTAHVAKLCAAPAAKVLLMKYQHKEVRETVRHVVATTFDLHYRATTIARLPSHLAGKLSCLAERRIIRTIPIIMVSVLACGARCCCAVIADHSITPGLDLSRRNEFTALMITAVHSIGCSKLQASIFERGQLNRRHVLRNKLEWDFLLAATWWE